jgi:hypothetical protein
LTKKSFSLITESTFPETHNVSGMHFFGGAYARGGSMWEPAAVPPPSGLKKGAL